MNQQYWNTYLMIIKINIGQTGKQKIVLLYNADIGKVDIKLAPCGNPNSTNSLSKIGINPRKIVSQDNWTETMTKDDSDTKISIINRIIERMRDFSGIKNISVNLSPNTQEDLAQNILSAISDQVDFLKYDYPPIR